MKTSKKNVHSKSSNKNFTILSPKKLTQLTGGWIGCDTDAVGI